jgi:hypothetical protein
MRPTEASGRWWRAMSTENRPILNLPLKPPQNVTDVITIVGFDRKEQ